MRRGIFLVFVLFLVERYGVNKSNTAKSSFKRYKPVPKSGLERAWNRIIKPVTTLALCFAIGVCSANTAKADEYLWKRQYIIDEDVDSANVIYFQVIDGDTLPCTEETTDSVDTDWVFQTIADTSGNVYYINKRDSIDSEGALWDWVIVQFVGERGTKAELEARYRPIANRFEFIDAGSIDDTTTALWILVEGKEYNLRPPPWERNFYFYPFNDTDYREAVRVEYRGNSEEYWCAITGGPVYSLPFEAIELSVEERSRLPAGSKLSVYPSPANSIVNMILGKESDYGKVRIYDETGRLVSDIHVSGGYGKGVRVDVSGLSSGVYSVVFDGADVHGNKITAKGKFVVVK